MNRPTTEVDELLDLADEALAEGDSPAAINFLRQATKIAPLRRDIRNRLALALEGTPVAPPPRRSLAVPADDHVVFEDFSLPETDVVSPPAKTSSGMDALKGIVDQAFAAASDQGQKAKSATRNLTSILHQGLETWRSSLASRGVAEEPVADAAPAASAQDSVFQPERDLQEYMERAETAAAPLIDANLDEAYEEVAQEEIARVVRPTSTSRKSSRTTVTKKQRPRDVEDVLAAGIGGFIEAIAQANKRKIAYGCVYVAMVAFFGYACFDVARKFPGGSGIGEGQPEGAASNVATASVGIPGQKLSVYSSSAEAIAAANTLVAEGKRTQAIAVLTSQLESSGLLANRDQLRVELATQLNLEGEEKLRNNQFAASVAAYKQAVAMLPNDVSLQVRLANALYYQATMDKMSSSEKAALLKDAEHLLAPLSTAGTGDVQTDRLLALVYEGRGESKSARQMWHKVKERAGSDSALASEAASHLK